MTTQYAEEQGFKKKYLAPLIVLMLCAVSLTGAAYAYSTSVTGHGDISGDYISIDLYTDGEGKSVLNTHLSSESFKVYTIKDDGVFKAYVDSTNLVYTTYVMVSSDIKGAEFTLAAEAGYTAPVNGAKLIIDGISEDGASTAKDVDVTAKMVIHEVDPDTYEAKTDAYTGNLSANTVYQVVITFAVGGNSVQFIPDFTELAILQNTLKAIDDDENAGFKFTFTAEKTA